MKALNTVLVVRFLSTTCLTSISYGLISWEANRLIRRDRDLAAQGCTGNSRRSWTLLPHIRLAAILAETKDAEVNKEDPIAHLLIA
jgi:hypothetical protein